MLDCELRKGVVDFPANERFALVRWHDEVDIAASRSDGDLAVGEHFKPAALEDNVVGNGEGNGLVIFGLTKRSERSMFIVLQPIPAVKLKSFRKLNVHSVKIDLVPVI